MATTEDTFRVQVTKNMLNGKSEELTVDKNSSFSKFKKDVARRLQMKHVKRIFLPSGAEVFNVDEIEANILLYVSQGEDFHKSENKSSEQRYNVSVLGSGGVGKSALTLRFVRDFFVENWDPTIEDAYGKSMSIDGVPCKLEILDTAGQDDFESLRPQWMMDKDGYIFVYSMNNPASLDLLNPFFELHKQINGEKKIPIVLVANKKDTVDPNSSEPSVSREQGEATAKKMGALYIETSAASGENVSEAFETLVRNIRNLSNPKTRKKSSGRCIIC